MSARASGAEIGSMDPELREALEATLDSGIDAADDTRPFSMVIRGGVSLGAYEAGVNWAILRLLKDLELDPKRTIRPELYAAAGASAGAVNGFLAGMLWCTDEASAGKRRDTLDRNVFRDTWLSIDINALIDDAAEGDPDPQEAAEDSGAFSRKALRKVIDAGRGGAGFS